MAKRIFQFKRMYLLLGFPAGLILVLLARWNNTWVEHLYARGLHVFFEKTVGRLVSFLPFSLTEWLVVAAVAAAVAYIVFVICRLCKDKTKRKHILYRAGINALCVGAAAYFLFVITMGLGYYRYSITEYTDFTVEKHSKEQLAEVCEWLIDGANRARAELSEDENGVAKLESDDWWNISAEAQSAFNKIGDRYPGIGKVAVRNKPMVFSEVMSRTLTMGVYFPYTFESNINVKMTAYTVPVTMCHELSHVKGFMKEDEASFLGFLACMNSDRAEFRYSGYTMAFDYALGQLADADRDLAVKVAEKAADGVRRDDAADGAYWKQYRHTVISDTSGKIYETYLQANDQPDGLQSYGQMVDLLIAWYYSEVKA